MKKITFLFTVLAMLGLGVACDREIEREEEFRTEEMRESAGEGMEEMEEEGTQFKDNVEETGEEIVE